MARDLIIDAGANRGMFSLTLAERNPSLIVLAIEPEPQLAADLDRQAAARALENHITRRLAVACEEGEARFFVSHEGDWGTSSLLQFASGHLREDAYWATRADLRHTAEIVVSTQRLESILNEHEYGRIAFLKIDTQGLDVDVLRSLGSHLERLDAGMLEVVGAPCRSLYENEQSTMLKALSFLSENGFEPYAVKPNDPAANEFNVYFTRIGIDYRAVEERLALPGVEMYDGKHYWLVPSSSLSDPMAELASVRARVEQLTDALGHANEATRAAALEREAARAEHFAEAAEHAARIEALGRSLETTAGLAVDVQQRYIAAQIRYDALSRSERAKERLIRWLRRDLHKRTESNTALSERLAHAKTREAEIASALFASRGKLQRLQPVVEQLEQAQVTLRQVFAERETLRTRLSEIEGSWLYRAARWAVLAVPARNEAVPARNKSAPSQIELLDTRSELPHPRTHGEPVIYYDVTDLVRHAQHSDKVTGIQRVVLEGLRGIGIHSKPIFLSPATGKWYVLDGLDVSEMQDLSRFRGLWERADLVEFPTRSNVTHYLKHRPKEHGRMSYVRLHRHLVKIPAWRRKLNRYTARFVAPQAFPGNWPRMALLPMLQPDDKLVLFGTPWNAQHAYEELFKSAPRTLEKIILVYDLIPLNSPYVPDSLRDHFRSFIPFVLRNASRIIINSDSVASDLTQYAQQNGYAVPQLHKINLAHHFPPEIALRGDISLRVRKLFSERYVLCVGSIESRKNHINLLTMWSKFVASADYYGEKLVIAGNWLWDFTAIQNHLHETGHVNGSVIIIEGPSDVELRELYAHCRFTAYPSHYEGFGLPVGESLTHGKPCLHFDNSSLVEAGCGLSDFVPYHDLRWYYQAFRRLMIDDLFYADRCRQIAEGQGRLRFWRDFSQEVAAVLRS